MKYLLLLLLLCCSHGYGQNRSHYLKMPGIKDVNGLIIKSGTNLDNDNSLQSFFVVTADSAMQFGVFNVNKSQVVKKYTLNEEEKGKLTQEISKLHTIEEVKLNNVNNDKGGEIYTPDGVEYEVLIYKDTDVRKYSTYAPEVFIEREYPGFKERKKLVDIVKALDFRKTITATDIDAVKRADTIYIKQNDLLKEVIDKGGSLNIGTETFVINTTGKTKTVKDDNEAFFKKQRSQIIDFDFFLKYGSNLMFLKSKKIFVIDAKQDNQIMLKEVKVFMLPTM